MVVHRVAVNVFDLAADARRQPGGSIDLRPDGNRGEDHARRETKYPPNGVRVTFDRVSAVEFDSLVTLAISVIDPPRSDPYQKPVRDAALS